MWRCIVCGNNSYNWTAFDLYGLGSPSFPDQHFLTINESFYTIYTSTPTRKTRQEQTDHSDSSTSTFRVHLGRSQKSETSFSPQNRMSLLGQRHGSTPLLKVVRSTKSSVKTEREGECLLQPDGTLSAQKCPFQRTPASNCCG